MNSEIPTGKYNFRLTDEGIKPVKSPTEKPEMFWAFEPIPTNVIFGNRVIGVNKIVFGGRRTGNNFVAFDDHLRLD